MRKLVSSATGGSGPVLLPVADTRGDKEVGVARKPHECVRSATLAQLAAFMGSSRRSLGERLARDAARKGTALNSRFHATHFRNGGYISLYVPPGRHLRPMRASMAGSGDDIDDV